ncbi:TetR/AcrR family transcriptional regulator [Tomitella fengzijianii]|uniref:TetR/AcrR family transcriptional regulator n=1 Tax=Tomitella fengzijianii TaxID=2597660 RepID=A0A516X442_9ACTN|nr:TetR/AcrR family transcriptional regulator [Tomitella fengzijianii]QDQ97421.1 TetR/AcrR family transcriptional regulator [Tomitella fengzijianii]
MPRVSEDHRAARRSQILDGARRCFAEYGYEGATVRRLEEATGLSRGAIFHHFRDKEALFLALAEDDAQRMADTAAEQGLVQVMRDVLTHPERFDWLATRLEITRRLRTDADFRRRWAERSGELSAATGERLRRQKAAGRLRDDVTGDVLQDYLELVLDGLITRVAGGHDAGNLAEVLDLVEESVRKRD